MRKNNFEEIKAVREHPPLLVKGKKYNVKLADGWEEKEMAVKMVYREDDIFFYHEYEGELNGNGVTVKIIDKHEVTLMHSRGIRFSRVQNAIIDCADNTYEDDYSCIARFIKIKVDGWKYNVTPTIYRFEKLEEDNND